MRALLGWFVAYFARWLPHRAPTGLLAVGHPGADSPVLVTANFSLTVKRVRRALAGQDVWLLVANSEGINVWCAAAGGIFTENRVIDAIKVSRLSEKVSHHQIVIPPLAAPGVDREAVKRETGFRCLFGPVYARDIPAYLEARQKKTDRMRRFDFGPRHRLDMFLPMNFPVYLLVTVVLALVAPGLVPGFTILFWAAVAALYLLLDVIPGKTGWGQAMLAALVVVLAWTGIDGYLRGNPFAHWGWLVATFLVFFAAGFDIAGTLSPRTSDAEQMMQRLGFKRFGSLFVETEGGTVVLDTLKCRGCLTCREVCPVGVFSNLDSNKKVGFKDQEACFGCGACVKQCPEGALGLGRT
jgi:NAD-dependent dihydropyrimidine dehydrogenase PreA subunit